MMRPDGRGEAMALRFNADEVLKMAEQIELNAERFYRHAAGLKADPRTQSTLLELAAWENQHYDTFAGMRARLTPEQRGGNVFDPDQELPLYLRAMADRRVFDVYADPVERLSGRETMEQILELALGMEKDSVVFYLGMQDLVPPEVGRDQVEAIIKEEMSHISIISGRLRAVAEE